MFIHQCIRISNTVWHLQWCGVSTGGQCQKQFYSFDPEITRLRFSNPGPEVYKQALPASYFTARVASAPARRRPPTTTTTTPPKRRRVRRRQVVQVAER